MIFTFLISIVFIAELIITLALIKILFDLDKKILSFNLKLDNSKENIKDICNLTKKISFQLKILSQDFINKIKDESENIFFKKLSKMLISLLIIKLNFKIIKQARKAKITKTLIKGFNLLENMI